MEVKTKSSAAERTSGGASRMSATVSGSAKLGTRCSYLTSSPFAKATTFASGKVGQTFKFDGTNDHVTVPDAPSLRPTSLTIEGWFQFEKSDGIRASIAPR